MTRPKRGGRFAPRRDAGRPRGEPVKEEVLTRTLEEVARQGVDGMRVEVIAHVAGVNKTSVYRRWPTREALAEAALESAKAIVLRPVPDTGTLQKDLLEFVRSLMEFMSSPRGRAIARIALDNSMRAGPTAKVASQFWKQVSRTMRPVMGRARDRGEWRRDASGERLALSLTESLFHLPTHGPPPVVSNRLRRLVDHHLLGVLRRETGPVKDALAPRPADAGGGAADPNSQPGIPDRTLKR